ncbi:MAG: hypothetical protein ABI702_06495 [Burkholderiales bacterium]
MNNSRPNAPNTSPSALPRGTRISDFEIERVLAETATSIVYLAIDRRSGVEVVVKEYMPQQLTRRERGAMQPRAPENADTLARGLQAFIAEAKLLVQFDQPTLVHVKALIETNGTAYQVMPQRGGAKLLDVRPDMRVPPDEPALRVLLDGLLDALEPLHRYNTLHGAVNPGNILLLAEGKPLLLGPELARAAIASGVVESLMAIVEPSFAAPEQLRPSASQAIGPWTDLYSVAETLRFCISGELPPPAATPLGGGRRETMKEMLQRRFGLLPDVRYSAPLLTVLDTALDPNTGARPQSVAEFRAALETMPPAKRVDAWISGAPPGATGMRESRVEPQFDLRRPPQASASPAPQTPKPPTFGPPFAAARDPAPAPTLGRGAARATVPPRTPWLPREGPVSARPASHTLLWTLGAVLILAASAAGWWWRSTLHPGAAPAEVTAAGPVLSEPRAPEVTAPPLPAPPPASSSSPLPAPPLEATSPSYPAPPVPVTSPVQTAPPVEAVSAPQIPAPAPTPAPLPATTAPATATRPLPTPTRPTANAAARPPVERPKPGPASPREVCADRTQFALYRCMQAQCEQKGWSLHPQCVHLRQTDSVD